jgi:hypothetical protein
VRESVNLRIALLSRYRRRTPAYCARLCGRLVFLTILPQLGAAIYGMMTANATPPRSSPLWPSK